MQIVTLMKGTSSVPRHPGPALTVTGVELLTPEEPPLPVLVLPVLEVELSVLELVVLPEPPLPVVPALVEPEVPVLVPDVVFAWPPLPHATAKKGRTSSEWNGLRVMVMPLVE
jgi:hypothetical protein